MNDNEQTVEAPSSALPFRRQDFFCKHCNMQYNNSLGIPEGWYVVKKSHGPDITLKTVSIVCSFECLLLDAAYEASTRLERARKSY